MLAPDANFKQAVLVLRRKCSNRLRLQLPSLVVTREDLIAFVNVLDRNIAMVGVNRRSGRKA